MIEMMHYNSYCIPKNLKTYNLKQLFIVRWCIFGSGLLLIFSKYGYMTSNVYCVCKYV
jgi:hypothetical protein